MSFNNLKGFSARLKSRSRILGQGLPSLGTGLIKGTARARSGGRPLANIERAARHKSIFGQQNRFACIKNMRSCVEGGGGVVNCVLTSIQNREKILKR